MGKHVPLLMTMGVAVAALVLAMVSMRESERLAKRVDEIERTRLHTDVFLRQVERDVREHNEIRDQAYAIERRLGW